MYSPGLGRFTGRDPLDDIENTLGVGVFNFFYDNFFAMRSGTGAIVPKQVHGRNDLERNFDQEHDLSGGYAFCGNNVNHLDPTGLVKVIGQSENPILLNCGAYSWNVTYTVDSTSHGAGYIAQIVELENKSYKCGSGDIDDGCTFSGKYLELFPVAASSKKTAKKYSYGGVQYENAHDGDVFSSYECETCTYGTKRKSGEAYFVAASQVTGPVSPGGATTLGGGPFTIAAEMQSWQHLGDFINVNNLDTGWRRSIGITWSCCSGDSNSKLSWLSSLPWH